MRLADVHMIPHVASIPMVRTPCIGHSATTGAAGYANELLLSFGFTLPSAAMVGLEIA